MQMGFYFDQTRCTGCFACIIACKDWNNIPAGSASWRRVITLEKGEYPDPFVAFLSTSCYHCDKPQCISVCPVDAISKREFDGIVVVAPEVCLGKDCSKCVQSCPYNAPQFSIEENAKMKKCNFCIDRLEKKLNPVCVDACPIRALDFGPLDELRAKYGDIREAEGFVYYGNMDPSVVFMPKIDKKGRVFKKIVTAPYMAVSQQ